jgi:aryl-alcohol dehydrogenase-like predicted oxidoreductase
VYGESERIVGRVLARRPDRDSIFVCSKSLGLDGPAIRGDLETTLRQLRRDRVDLYYLHMPPDDPDAMRRTLDVFVSLKAEGWIRAIGVSIRGARVGPETAALCRSYLATGWVDAVQLIYSIMRQDNASVFPEADAAGVAVVARTVLESGFLTGKFDRSTRFDSDDQRHRWQPKLDGVLEAVDALRSRFAKPPYADLAQLAMAFALADPRVATIIPGGKTVQQVRTNAGVSALPPLPDALRDTLCAAYRGMTPLFNPPGK